MENKLRRNILIVDNEVFDLEILNNILGEQYDLSFVKSGKDAFHKATQSIPDIILLDILLTDIDAFDLLTELKQNELTSHIPVLFIAGSDIMKKGEKGFSLGAVDYIAKPFHSSLVKARIETHLKIGEQVRTMEDLIMWDIAANMPNMRAFNKQLEIEWARGRRQKSPLGLIIAETSSLTGNAIQAISKEFMCSLRRKTDMSFRLQNERFAALLPNTDESGTKKVSENIQLSIERAAFEFIPPVSAKVGFFAGVPSGDNSNAATFVRNAEEAIGYM